MSHSAKTLIVGLGLVFVASAATAQNYSYDTPGTYFLPANSTSISMFNINITANDVTLDLNGKVVRCNPSSPATEVTFGIYAPERARVKIRNGSITGCFFGIHAGYGSQITIENVDFTGNTYIGANLGGGTGGNIVRGSTFAAIAGYTVEAYAIGVNGIGSGGVVENNTFRNLYRQPNAGGTGEGVGVLVEANATNVTIRNNTFINDSVAPNTIGIWFASGTTGDVRNNTIKNFKNGIQGAGNVTVAQNTFTLTQSMSGSIAISMSSGVASNNAVTGYATILSGGITDGGGNGPPTDPPPPPPPSPGGRWFKICVDNGSTCYQGILLPAPPGD